MKKLINSILAFFKTKEKPFSLDQVKKDLLSGKFKKIYYSGVTLWWSHDPADLVETTRIGKEFLINQHNQETKVIKEKKSLNRDKLSKREKLFESFKNAKDVPPLDFLGNRLFETIETEKWISGAESHPEAFGRNGLDAFMRMHHKNCKGRSFKTWDEVNYDIDGLAVVTEKNKPATVKNISDKMTPGRNDLCPCGSGRKFKHCCANN